MRLAEKYRPKNSRYNKRGRALLKQRHRPLTQVLKGAPVADAIVHEEWRAVPGWDGMYSVSNLGRVRSDARGKGRYFGRCLKPGSLKAGYLKLTLAANGRHEQWLVHRLVLLAFVGPCPAGKETNHKNGVKHDNTLSNLEYVTASENQKHIGRVLGIKRPNPVPKWGEDHHRTTLTAAQVAEIRRRYAAGGVFQRQLGEEFGVSQTCIGKIVRGQRWLVESGAMLVKGGA